MQREVIMKRMISGGRIQKNNSISMETENNRVTELEKLMYMEGRDMLEIIK